MISLLRTKRESGSKSPKLLCLILTTLLLFSCEKYEKQTLVKTGTIEPSYKSATVQGTIIDAGEGITEHGHCWALYPVEPTVDLETISTKGEAHTHLQFTSTLNQLLPDKEYKVRAYAITEFDTVYGEAVPFKTRDGVIVFSDTRVLDKSETSIKCTTTITEDGGSPITIRGICWSKSLHPTVWGDTIVSGKGMGEYSIEITDLEPAIPYNIHFFAINENPKPSYSTQLTIYTRSSK